MEDYARHQRKEPKENARGGALGAEWYYLSYNFDAKVLIASRKSQGFGFWRDGIVGDNA